MSSIPNQTITIAKHRASLIYRMQTLGEVLSTETALFHHTAATALKLGITDIKALSVLLQEGAMSAGILSERLCLTTGAVTSVIDRLEGKGYVKRQYDPNDRRKVIVVAIKQKLSSTQNVYDLMGKAFSRQLEKYSTEELEFLIHFYRDIIELTKKEVSNVRSGIIQ